jgi:hypothetical protein
LAGAVAFGACSAIFTALLIDVRDIGSPFWCTIWRL